MILYKVILLIFEARNDLYNRKYKIFILSSRFMIRSFSHSLNSRILLYFRK